MSRNSLLDEGTKWLSVRSRTKWFWVRVQLQSFKFGDGKTVSSLKSVSIPAQICKREVSIKTHVTDNKLPIFLSKKAMKKAETKIDFTKDKINILGQEMDIKTT